MKILSMPSFLIKQRNAKQHANKWLTLLHLQFQAIALLRTELESHLILFSLRHSSVIELTI
jgi:hypothetical protein